MKRDLENSAPGRVQALPGDASAQLDDPPFVADPVQKEATDRIGMIANLDELPAVRAYLNRVGATAINFVRAEVRVESGGYHESVVRIDFAKDGEVTVKGDVDAPTEAEQAEIKSAFEKATFPKMSTMLNLPDSPPGVNPSARNVFPCHNFEGEIAMLHERYETKDGGKGFVPWTRWSDGQWRKMEPVTLPFYGLNGYQVKSTLVLHEGAKSAALIKRLQSGVERPEKFPWWAELEHAHHVGWIGGVYAVDRSDWTRLAACNWSRIIVVADNDEMGVIAANQIAAKFPTNVYTLCFDTRWPDRFDLADPWPEALFDDAGVYIGPSMRDCLIPATRATLVLPAVGRGRPTVVLRHEFAALVAYTVEPPRIILRHNPSRDFRPEQFNMVAAPISDVKDTATKVYQTQQCQHDRMVYRPGERAGTLTVDGGRGFNVYEGGVAAISGDPGPWLEYLAHLFPVEMDRELVLRWLATLIAMPKVRMTYGLLLISATQGVGKSTLGIILRLVLGQQNVSFPSESSIVDSAFNGWLARKRLIFVNEFYSGHSRKAYDRIKPYVTDEWVPINEKGVPEYQMENYATFIACSNSEAALHLDDEDRRWLVPTVAEAIKPRQWWADLHAWIAGEGPGIVQNWAESYVAGGNHVRSGEHAPDSARKEAIVEGSRSEGQQFAVQLGEHLMSLGREVILRTRDVRAWVAVQRGFKHNGEPDLSDRRLEKPDTLLRVMKKVPGITVWANTQRPKFGATRDSVVMNFQPKPEETWSEIKDRLTDLEGVNLNEPF